MSTILALLLVGLMAASVGAAPAAVERTEGALVFGASVPKSAFAPGEAVEIRLTVRNAGSTAQVVTFMSAQRFEFVVRRARGDEVWRWSHDKAFAQAIETAQLRPGETMTFRETWDQRDLQGRRVDAGSYEVVAIFLGQVGGRASVALPPIGITITPR
ncbi:MAG: BsuPI-related putative proteinase inhibitor [Armatimonadota bacterium]|nr:BsuPI-related putative proteinase inhibitor [Armatimonadota bacterium]MDR7451598.1 BsuPI-related putative proteinase inhibitor [Armatimonadota bacterium]MDR7467682.1 BsuPI-related putative proteinase inhibitor [Armatimonadota bacterium]MDR7492567.1 BsuPI-related putative proteinase inhibitor [Armatimonadota bacterium]MDR7499965.1 BsuPI-related putative proteinase inhibitor [Armatimonadota bacterium]